MFLNQTFISVQGELGIDESGLLRKGHFEAALEDVFSDYFSSPIKNLAVYIISFSLEQMNNRIRFFFIQYSLYKLQHNLHVAYLWPSFILCCFSPYILHYSLLTVLTSWVAPPKLFYNIFCILLMNGYGNKYLQQRQVVVDCHIRIQIIRITLIYSRKEIFHAHFVLSCV